MKHPNPIKAEARALIMNKFAGTDNQRHLRAIGALMRCPMPRERLGDAVGASKSLELLAEPRRRGLDVPSERIRFIDRDGCLCRPGAYFFTSKDRRLIWAWQAKRMQGGRLE